LGANFHLSLRITWETAGDRPHGVFDPRPLNADVETDAHFAFERRAENGAGVKQRADSIAYAR
jgi:hypothetical protein